MNVACETERNNTTYSKKILIFTLILNGTRNVTMVNQATFQHYVQKTEIQNIYCGITNLSIVTMYPVTNL